MALLPWMPRIESQPTTVFAQLREQGLPFPIVQLNYRLSPSQPFPTPVHDVLRGYDWIKEHLFPKRALALPGRPQRNARLAVCGELLGGGLAAMLALTECRVGQPGIVAAALSNPMVDWVDLNGESAKTERMASAPIGSNAAANALSTEIQSLRSKLFRKPEHYFDPFASPMLFLRSAGGAIPSAPPDVPIDDMEHLTQLNREEFRSVTEPVQEEAKPLRKTSKRYPSPLLGLRLPAFHIHAGKSSSLLSGQAEEFVLRLRQAHVRQAGEQDFGRKVLDEDEIDDMSESEKSEIAQREVEARKKAQLSVSQDLGLWDSSAEGRARVAEMARWVSDALR
ncbi:hypothetical protein LTR35_004398 [Friedmanniomyces endolithicus]|uniref:Alpha/beta hydrolase fold-3 domain-containing protein n=1 Tax=Friedmanniomyces endolithicus TaxID=329885 RepID=A0AAN6JDW7_9PEZI|nr:hypothetical protein LTR35_004398 [Friedmanniomyces endolithicus]KAK0295524.1 hypothetical protein LTS00_005724 [Friedmanniomyces endolithicus]KAK0326516.1 hypothetical protein LTR82_002358 [Friedmanniomyces endolithicus]KAK1017467.1 hypothetical protein LTR54_002125 [Friedmanniomyces endolithicus]